MTTVMVIDLNQMFDGLIGDIVRQHKDVGDLESFRQASLATLGMDPKMDAADFNEADTSEIAEEVDRQFREFYNRKMGSIAHELHPRIKDIEERMPGRYKRVVIPFTDGSTHPLPVSAEIQKAIETEGKSIVRDVEKAVTLAIIDDRWKEHLRAMDELKESSQAASFEQKDPLVIYKMEAYNLFESFIFQQNAEVTSYLAKGDLERAEQELQQAREVKSDLSKTQTNHEREEALRRSAAARAGRERKKVETFQRDGKKVGRNEPCPCGSGKKYKHCHGR